MATANDGRSPYESGAAEDRVCKRPFRPEIYEEPQHVSHEAGRNDLTGASESCTHRGGNSASISAATRISKLEQMMKQMTFTRSETQRLISLLHSRTIEESQTPPLRLEASITTSLMKRHKHGDERDNFHASVVSSRVLEEEIDQDLKFNNKNGTGFPLTSMGSPQQPMTIENLPHELLSNIFIRLLAKQLAQMRSVSRCWNALLSQSSFVKSHLHHSIHNNEEILLVFHDEEHSSSDYIPFTAKPSRSPHLELANFIKLPVNQQSEYTNGIRVIGSINGLICSAYGESIIHIWNPSLSAVLTLPPYSTPTYGYNSIRCHFRFGFDPKTDDYKVVKLTGLTGPYINAVTWWLQVEIYSMRKGSWKLITERFPSHIASILNGDHVFVDGHDGRLHWLGYNCISGKSDLERNRIVAFDLGSETFREIPLPDSIVVPERFNQTGVLAEKLCVISSTEDDAYEVWVMDEYGVSESWVKHHVFSHFSGITIPLGFTSHNEFVIKGDSFLVLYNPSTNKQEILEDPCPEEYGIDKVVEYVDSLVWVAPAKHEMVDGGGQN